MQNASIRAFSSRQKSMQVAGGLMHAGDRVEDAADERALLGRAGLSGRHLGQSSPASLTISPRTATNSSSAASRIRSGVSVSERIVWRICGRTDQPQPALALARGDDDVAKVLREGRSRAAFAAAAAAPSRGRRAVTAASSDALAAATASSMSSTMPGSCSSAVSAWNRPTGRPSPGPTQRLLGAGE